MADLRRRVLHRLAPYARRVRAACEVAGPALSVLIMLPRPRAWNRPILLAAAAGQVADWLARAAEGDAADWRHLPVGPAASLLGDAALAAGAEEDRVGYCAWLRVPSASGPVAVRVAQGDGAWAPALHARPGDQTRALAALASSAWSIAGGVVRLAPRLCGAVEGLSAEPASRGLGAPSPLRAGPPGAVAAAAAALWPSSLGGAATAVALCGPRGSALRAIARQAAAFQATRSGLGAAGARTLEVESSDLLGAVGAVSEAAGALRPRLLSVRVGPADRAALTLEAAREVARSAGGDCAIALLCEAHGDARDAPLGPGDSALEVEAPGDLEEALWGAGDPGEDEAALALHVAAGGREDAAAEARGRLQAAWGAVPAGLRDEARGWPIGFAVEALLRAADASTAEEAEDAAESASARAEVALEDYARGRPDDADGNDEQSETLT